MTFKHQIGCISNNWIKIIKSESDSLILEYNSAFKNAIIGTFLNCILLKSAGSTWKLNIPENKRYSAFLGTWYN